MLEGIEVDLSLGLELVAPVKEALRAPIFRQVLVHRAPDDHCTRPLIPVYVSLVEGQVLGILLLQVHQLPVEEDPSLEATLLLRGRVENKLVIGHRNANEYRQWLQDVL